MAGPEHADRTDSLVEEGRAEDLTPATSPPGRARRWGEFVGVLQPSADRDPRSHGQIVVESVAATVPLVIAVTTVGQHGWHHFGLFDAGWLGGGVVVAVLLRLVVASWYARRHP